MLGHKKTQSLGAPAAPAPITISLDDLVTVTEAATLLHVSVACIRTWLSTKRLPRVHAGRRVLISKASLHAMLRTSGNDDQVVPAQVSGGAF